MVTLIEASKDIRTFEELPSLTLLKRDIYRYLLSSNDAKCKELQKHIDDDEYLKVKVENNYKSKYFNNGTKCYFKQGTNTYLQIGIGLYIGSEFSSSINFEIDMRVNLKGKSKEGTFPLHFDDKVGLLEFLNDWRSYDWKRLFNRAINKFRNDLDIESNSEESNANDYDKTLSELDNFIDTASSTINTIKFNTASGLAHAIYSLCDSDFESYDEVLAKLVKFYSNNRSSETGRGQLTNAMIQNDKDTYLDLLKDIEL